jgi:hypothetical protein
LQFLQFVLDNYSARHFLYIKNYQHLRKEKMKKILALSSKPSTTPKVYFMDMRNLREQYSSPQTHADDYYETRVVFTPQHIEQLKSLTDENPIYDSQTKKFLAQERDCVAVLRKHGKYTPGRVTKVSERELTVTIDINPIKPSKPKQKIFTRHYIAKKNPYGLLRLEPGSQVVSESYLFHTLFSPKSTSHELARAMKGLQSHDSRAFEKLLRALEHRYYKQVASHNIESFDVFTIFKPGKPLVDEKTFNFRIKTTLKKLNRPSELVLENLTEPLRLLIPAAD